MRDINWGKPYRKTRFDGKVFQIRKRKCTCECHKPNSGIIHFMACCNNGYVYQSKIVLPLGTKIMGLNVIVPNTYREYIKTIQ